MKGAPQVSVVIPAHNVSPYIRQAVESALTQTVTAIEVLVIDDGSTDGTSDQLGEIKDERLRIIRQAHAGVSVTRNVGIERSRAPYIGFLDGDDVWLPRKLEKHLALLEAHPESDLTFSLSRVIDATGRASGLPLLVPMEVPSFQELLRENVVQTSSAVVMRREAFVETGLFEPDLASCEDYEMWLRMARLRPNNLRCLKEVLTLYRRRPNQLTGDWRSVASSWDRMITKVRRTAERDVRAAEPEARSQMYSYLANLAREKEEFPQALRFLWKAFQSAPWTSLFRARRWLLTAACLSGYLLPLGWHRTLERVCTGWARAIHSWVVPD